MSADQVAATVLGEVDGLGVTAVYSSPSARCSEPAGMVAAFLGAPVEVDPRLYELDFGNWEGRRWDDIGAGPVGVWAEHWIDQGPPGGESARELEMRVHQWLTERPRGEVSVLVAHAGVVRALRVIVQGCSWKAAMSEPVPHLQRVSFEVD